MIRKSGANKREGVCAEIMLNQEPRARCGFRAGMILIEPSVRDLFSRVKRAEDLEESARINDRG
jgi:hypothetical protein